MTKSKGGYKIRPDGKKDTGRPTSMTSDTIAKLERSFSMGCTDEEACLYANIDKSTLYRYQQENPNFRDRKELLRNQPMMKARLNIALAIENGDTELSKWYAERKKKDEFSTKQEIGGVIVNASVAPDIEQIKQLKQALDE